MTGESITLPDRAYSEAEQAAREVTDSNADEYGRAGMHVGARWGGIAELRILLADVELHHGKDDPVAVRIQSRLQELNDKTDTDWPGDPRLAQLRTGWVASRKLDPAIGYPLAEMFRELLGGYQGGFRYSWGLVDAAAEAADAIAKATS